MGGRCVSGFDGFLIDHYAAALKKIRSVKSEAYFVAIIYPQSWFDDPSFEKSKLPIHFPQYFILAMSDVPGAGGVSGGTLRFFNRTGHGVVKFGVPATDSAFMMEIRNILKTPIKFITWIDSTPWNFMMEDTETGEFSGSI
jgi:hypothetical protein